MHRTIRSTLLMAGLSALAASMPAGAATAEDWNAFSRSTRQVFLADVDSIGQVGDVTSIRVAKAPLAGPDRTHTVETFEYRCEAGEYRISLTIYHGEDGVENDRFDDTEATFEPIVRETFPAYLKEVVCDGARADPPTWMSIAAFLDGR